MLNEQNSSYYFEKYLQKMWVIVSSLERADMSLCPLFLVIIVPPLFFQTPSLTIRYQKFFRVTLAQHQTVMPKKKHARFKYYRSPKAAPECSLGFTWGSLTADWGYSRKPPRASVLKLLETLRESKICQYLAKVVVRSIFWPQSQYPQWLRFLLLWNKRERNTATKVIFLMEWLISYSLYILPTLSD